MRYQFLQGNSLDVLKTFRDNTFHTVVTSPPYWQQRDYQVNDQIGQEATVDEYVDHLVQIMCEVKRTLRKDGTLWLNIGDTYVRSDIQTTLRSKNKIGVPWKVAFALQENGWILRQDVIWEKSNPMPDGSKDRPTTCHEYLFLLTKSEKYYYDYFAALENSEKPIKGKQKFGSREQIGTNRHDQNRTFEHYGKRNKRSVWTTSVSRFEGSHWATFNPELIEPCILTSTSKKGCCPKCKTGWNRIIDKTREESGQLELTGNLWEPGCSCGIQETESCVVLDPFSGASTTGFVCSQHNRDYVAIDVNQEYLNVARKRLGIDREDDIFKEDYITEYRFNSEDYFNYGNNV